MGMAIAWKRPCKGATGKGISGSKYEIVAMYLDRQGVVVVLRQRLPQLAVERIINLKDVEFNALKAKTTGTPPFEKGRPKRGKSQYLRPASSRRHLPLAAGKRPAMKAAVLSGVRN